MSYVWLSGLNGEFQMGSKFYDSQGRESVAVVELTTPAGQPIARATVSSGDDPHGVRTGYKEGLFEANRSGKTVDVRMESASRNPDGSLEVHGTIDTMTCYPKSGDSGGFCQPTPGGPKPRK
jgi:hypothetical protein